MGHPSDRHSLDAALAWKAVSRQGKARTSVSGSELTFTLDRPTERNGTHRTSVMPAKCPFRHQHRKFYVHPRPVKMSAEPSFAGSEVAEPCPMTVLSPHQTLEAPPVDDSFTRRADIATTGIDAPARRSDMPSIPKWLISAPEQNLTSARRLLASQLEWSVCLAHVRLCSSAATMLA